MNDSVSYMTSLGSIQCQEESIACLILLLLLLSLKVMNNMSIVKGIVHITKQKYSINAFTNDIYNNYTADCRYVKVPIRSSQKDCLHGCNEQLFWVYGVRYR